jgi:glycosyltransferase involved in cell wall biosynthesis
LHNRIVFLTLRTFSATGGIEKVCRIAGKAMYEMTLQQPASLQIFSMHDKVHEADDNKYFPSEIFRGFKGKQIKFVTSSVKAGLRSDILILSHINLLIVAWLVKKIAPKKKIILFAHGIEVWQQLSKRKRSMLKCCTQVFSVSNFTCKQLHQLHGLPSQKCIVLNNCLDPFLPLPLEVKNQQILGKYGFNDTHKILFTLTRLSSTERYKGYDKVMESVTKLKVKYPELRFFLAGTYDMAEKEFLEALKQKSDLNEYLYTPGYIPDEELGNYFSMADLYVMPSIKEGFGIVFIEAMYYGLPVIAGNLDGSVDALCNGALGILVDPNNQEEITNAIEKVIENRNAFIPNRDLLMKKFSYDTYKNNLTTLLDRIKN